MESRIGQRLGTQAVSGVLLVITAGAVIWIGAAFAAYAIYLAVLPRTGTAGAAGIVAVLFLIGPFGYWMVSYLRRPRPQLHIPERRSPPKEVENATLAMLADVAKDKPIIAVLIAGLMGAAETVLRDRN